MTLKHCKLPPIISRRQALAVGFAAACKLNAPWWMGPAEAYGIATGRAFPPYPGAGDLLFAAGGAYTVIGITTPANARAPDRSDAATVIQEDATTGSHILISPAIPKAASNIQYAFSFFGRRHVGTRNVGLIAIDTPNTNFSVRPSNLDTGAETTTPSNGGAGFTFNSGDSRYYPGGYVQLRMLATVSSAFTDFREAAGIETAASPGVYQYTGDNTSSIRLYRFRVALAADGYY